MNKTLSQLQKIFQIYFNDKKIKLKPSTTAKEIEKWDSLAQIGLILLIEKKYNLKFSIKDIEKLENIGGMVRLIEKKKK